MGKNSGVGRGQPLDASQVCGPFLVAFEPFFDKNLSDDEREKRASSN